MAWGIGANDVAFPRLNAQGGGLGTAPASPHMIWGRAVSFGTADKSMADIETAYGKWTAPALLGRDHKFSADPDFGEVFLRNTKTNAVYRTDDYLHGRVLPDPYPLKDDGAGLFFLDATDHGKGRVFAPIAEVVRVRRRDWVGAIEAHTRMWLEKGDTDAAHDAAVALARFAYQFPTVHTGRQLPAVASVPGAYGRDSAHHKRSTAAYWLRHYATYLAAPKAYDQLFGYIKDNQLLAESIGRFVPWVHTPQDVIRLLDVYLVQATAKRVMRYHYYTDPMVAAELAAILGHPDVIQPWMDWVFARTFVYPLEPAGIQNLMISGCDRSGPEYIGSTYYAQGEGARRVAEGVERFRALGVLPDKYDLTSAELYPKPLAQTYWQLNITVAGRDALRIGDVGGPDKAPGRTLDNLPTSSAYGWRHAHDPRFAWVLRHMDTKQNHGDDAWQAIEDAAATVKRAPWLDLTSRVVDNWAVVLETGLEHDDFRFRRAAYIRTGWGIGHHHDDTLDLQVSAHGLPMTIDGGQRPGYSSPGDRSTRLHNTVEVDGTSWRGHAWVSALADHEGARYTSVAAVPHGRVKLFKRQIMLMDVDDGQGSQPLSVDAQVTGRNMSADVVTPNSYVFDVFRVSGGSLHTYCFHGPVEDDLTVNPTLTPVVAVAEGEEPTPDQAYLSAFGRSVASWAAGTAGEAAVEATWRYTREDMRGKESSMATTTWNAQSPRKYTRLHLLGTTGMRILRTDAVCKKWSYDYGVLFAQRRGPEGAGQETVYTAVIEPFVGDAFITGRRLIPMDDNDTDAERAVAVEVTTRNGHVDVLFADGRPDRTRTLDDLTITAESAAYCTDADGLRTATITGGTILSGPHVRIECAQRERGATIVRVDYLKRVVGIDAAWPDWTGTRTVEIRAPGRTTSYTCAAVKNLGTAAQVTLAGGADYYRSIITECDAQAQTLTCQLKPVPGRQPGLDRGFTASTDSMTRFWRAEYLDKKRWRLTGGPIATADFAPGNALRIWEYGPGDRLRAATAVSVRRTTPNVYRIESDVQARVMFPGVKLEQSIDAETWALTADKPHDAWVSINIAPAPRTGDCTYVKVTLARVHRGR